jgi:hypothetical protein
MPSRLPKLDLSLGGGPSPLVGLGGVDADVADIDINQVMENLEIVEEFISYQVAKALTDVLITILAYAQPRVPVDTGELRESGTATLALDTNMKVVARGKADGSVSANSTGITPTAFKRKKVSVVLGFIEYSRISERGMLDIALWTHENLNPYEGRPSAGGKGKNTIAGWKQYYARTPGTGPKYLELAWLQHKRELINYIKMAVDMAPAELSKMAKRQKTAGKHTVEKVIMQRRYFTGVNLGGKFKGRGIL